MSGTELSTDAGLRLEDAAPLPTDRPDVPEAEAKRERPENPRDVQMRAIAERYERQQRGHEISYGEELTRDAQARDPQPEPEAPVESTPATEPAETPGDAHAASSHERPAATPPAPHGARQGDGGSAVVVPPGLRTVTIQGQQFGVTEEQFARLAEIGAMANMAMQQQQHGQGAPPQGHPWQTVNGHPQGYQNGHAQPAAAGPIIDRDAAGAIVQRLAYGGQEDGIAAVQELATNIAQQLQARHPQVDAAEIRRSAVAEALQTIETNTNLERIGQEFPEVFNDRSRAMLAAIHLIELRQRDQLTGSQTPPLQLYREACNMVRGAIGSPDTGSQPQSAGNGRTPAPQAASPTVAVNGNRLERKRAAPSTPTAASRASSLGQEAPRPPSNAEIVDWMRQKRGQLPMR